MTKEPSWLVVAAGIIFGHALMLSAAEPPAINPFKPSTSEREDALPGYVELSDGSIHPGQIYLTRDKRLKIADDQLQRQREVPLSAVKQIDCTIKKEWMEKEWKFKELTKDEKMYTGRSYPTREYEHTIMLQDGRKISGGLSAIVFVQAEEKSPGDAPAARSNEKPEQFILNKRNKGEIGEELSSLIYVKSIKLGNEAYEEGKQKAAAVEKKTGKNNKSGK